MNIKTKMTAFVAAGLLTAAVAPLPALAHTDVSLSIGLGLPPPVYVAPAPVYYAPPPPRYYAPAPVAYYPAPYYYERRVVYVDRGPRGYGPPPYGREHHRHHH